MKPMSSEGDRPGRILVIRGGAIGDFVLTLPALAALRACWPRARLVLAGHERTTGLAIECGLADEAVSLDRPEFARLFAPPGGISDPLFRSFDLCVTYLRDPDGSVEHNLCTAGVRRVLAIPPLPVGGHAADHLLAPLENLGVPVSFPAVPSLPLPAARRAAGRALLARYGERVAILHPGSGSPGKNWGAARFVGLAAELRAGAREAPVYSFGEADDAVREEVLRLDPRAVLLPAMRLCELAGCLAAAARYVGNDSGITHLAAAAGCPVLALFGPTDPRIWGPRGGWVEIRQMP